MNAPGCVIGLLCNLVCQSRFAGREAKIILQWLLEEAAQQPLYSARLGNYSGI